MRLRARSIFGWILLTAVALWIAALLGLPELTALAISALCCLCVSAAWLQTIDRRHRPTLNVTVSPDVVQVGERARVNILVGNPHTLESHPLPPSVLKAGLGSTAKREIGIGRLRSGATASLAFDLDTSRRGATEISGWSWDIRDPLQLWRRTKPAEVAASLLVRPRTHELDSAVAMSREIMNHAQSLSFGIERSPEAEIAGLRPYERGDDLRLIHWRTSARRNHPHVVQLEPHAPRGQLTLVLDTSASPENVEAFERTLEATASVIQSCAQAGITVQLLSTSGWVSDSVQANRLGILLDWLATAEPQGPPNAGSNKEADTAIREATKVLLITGGYFAADSASGALIGPRGAVVLSCAMEKPGKLADAHWVPGQPLNDAWSKVLRTLDKQHDSAIS